MAGIHGAKRIRTLSQNQFDLLKRKLFFVSYYGKKVCCLLKKDADDLIAQFNMRTVTTLVCRYKLFCKSKLTICYNWDDRENLDVSKKSYIFFVCQFCSEPSISPKSNLCNRKIKSFKSCGHCHAKNVSKLPEQIEINSAAQTIAQNKPDTLKKMSESIKNAWKRDYDKRHNAVKNSYKNNPAHRENVRKASIKFWQNDDYRAKQLKSTHIYGAYNSIAYQSLCELAFILWCEYYNYQIKRYDLPCVKYSDEFSVERSYSPDFIMNKSTIVEIKSSLDREKYLGRYNTVMLKTHAAVKVCMSNSMQYKIVEVATDIPRSFYSQACKIHHGKN